MSQKRTITHVFVAVLMAVGLFAVAAPAQADWSSNVAYKREGSVCQDNGDGTMTVGGKIFMKEFGQHGVTQLRTKFLLYDSDPFAIGIHVSIGNWTVASNAFPDDNRNFYFDSAHGNRHNFHVASGEYWVVAKMTWARDGRKDWNKKIPAAHCVFTVG